MYQASTKYDPAANIYGGQAQAATNGLTQAPTPRTIASAISRMEGLNERLGQARNALSIIADMLGALRDVPGKDGSARPIASGAIDRLNDSANDAHSQVSEIEGLVNAISTALG